MRPRTGTLSTRHRSLSHFAAWLLALGALGRGLAAHADPLMIAHGPIDRIFAAADGAVVALEADGGVLAGDLRRLQPLPAPASGAPVGPSDRLARHLEATLDELGVPQSERGAWTALDLLEDELSLADARARRGNPGAEVEPADLGIPVAAAATDGIYVIRGRTLWLVSARGRARRGRLGGRIHGLAAAPHGRVALLRDGALALSSDGGVTFRALAAAPGAGPGHGLARPIEHLAWSPSGERLACVAAESVAWCSPGEQASARLPSPVLDLRTCGDELLALTASGVFGLRGPSLSPRRLSGPLQGRRLACGVAGTWLAVDPGLSHAGPAAPPWAADARDVAFGPDGIWIASPHGLALLPSDPTTDRLAAEGLAANPVAPRPRGPIPPTWAALLPELSIEAGVSGSASPGYGRRDLWLMGSATFPLGRRPPEIRLAQLAQVSAQVSSDDLPPSAQGRPEGPVRASERGPAAPRPLAPEESACLVATRRRAVELAQVEPERARSLLRRAAQAAWLPELRLRVDRRLGRSESAAFGAPAPSTPLGLDTVNDLRYEARAMWDLGRLIFSPDEIAAGTQALRMADMRRDIESLVVRLFFERRRLAPDGRTAERELRAQEIAAELDALSDGHFSRCSSPAPSLPAPSP